MESLIVRPRSEGDPEPDLIGMALAHRALRGEVRKLAEFTARQGGSFLPPGQEAALRRFLAFLMKEVHSHHVKEDEVLWPVIAASAGAAVDLAPLTEEHREIDPCVDRILASSGRERARALAELADLLDEHIVEEERALFPVMLRYVSAEDFAACEKKFQADTSLGHMKLVLPLMVSYATDEEWAHIKKTAGLPVRIMLRMFRPGYQKLQRAVYGS
ncbi:hemerythrin domain-containing protein [Actinocorallia sp. B10E7]|uniref:hemerythrin domain-containing protein n=1 Tax=Actinocorallia sp. B10E7 TaxID=3153558 RepID=UPI00325C7FBA